MNFGIRSLLILCIGLCALWVSPASARDDGHWWIALSEEERDAYFRGEADCYLYEFKGPRHINGSRRESVRRITQYYRDDPSARTLVVSDVIQRLAEPVDYTQAVPEHAYFDGEFWRMLFTPSEKYLFVQGYLACLETHTGRRAAKPVAEYVAALSEHFGTSDTDPGEGNPATSGDKIGHILGKLFN